MRFIISAEELGLSLREVKEDAIKCPLTCQHIPSCGGPLKTFVLVVQSGERHYDGAELSMRKGDGMIELTPEQRQALSRQSGSPLRAIDPDTQTGYVLIREETYDRVKALFAEEEDNQSLRGLYPHVMEVFGREGWDDPAMDVYDELDPRRKP